MDEKKFIVGKRYYPGDRSYDPVKVVKRTAKYIYVSDYRGFTWRMLIRIDHDGTEYCIDSTMPSRYKSSFMYCADDPVKED